MTFLDSIMQSQLTFPVLECFHIVGFAIGAGTIAVVDFRLLNLGLRSHKPADLASGLSIWTVLGLGVAFLAGAGLYMSDPDMYYLNHAFQVKMALLLIALVFHYTVHEKAVAAGGSNREFQWAAAVSLLLWAGIVGGGIFTGFAGEGL